MVVRIVGFMETKRKHFDIQKDKRKGFHKYFLVEINLSLSSIFRSGSRGNRGANRSIYIKTYKWEDARPFSCIFFSNAASKFLFDSEYCNINASKMNATNILKNKIGKMI